MKLYIPEIGDKLTLIEDWNFTLYPEQRNVSLAEYLGYKLGYFNTFVPISIVGDKPVFNSIQPLFKVGDPKGLFSKYSYDDWKFEFSMLNRDTSKEYDIALEEYDNLVKSNAIHELPVTLPKYTILTVDRIYIRKGSKDFSSISFYAKLPDIKNKTKIRFWVKLKDCNNINYEINNS